MDALCGYFDVWFRGSQDNPTDNEVRLTTSPDPTGERRRHTRGVQREECVCGGGGRRGRGSLWARTNRADGGGACVAFLRESTRGRMCMCWLRTPHFPHALGPELHGRTHTHPTPRLSSSSPFLSRRHALGPADLPAAPVCRLRAGGQAAAERGRQAAPGQPAPAERGCWAAGEGEGRGGGGAEGGRGRRKAGAKRTCWAISGAP